jgi:hypothetical protein
MNEQLELEQATEEQEQNSHAELVLWEPTPQEPTGFWVESPASLGVLKSVITHRSKKREAILMQVLDWTHGVTALTVCAASYSALWMLRLPISTERKRFTPPSPGRLRADIESRGMVGRSYGYAVAAPAHALGYGLTWAFMLPKNTLAVLPFVITLLVILFL